MRTCIFLGPTLPVAEARKLLDAEFLPPAAAGDICELMLRPSPPARIALIDGLFGFERAVWHKEILYALAKGTAVYGCSSMGALRAAELAPFGMVGVGSVFEAFSSGQFSDDDEVAVVHAGESDGFRTLSEAMVNLRWGLAQARTEGILSGAQCAHLVTEGKRLFYPERSWRRLLVECDRLGIAGSMREQLRGLVDARRPDIKRDDALQLLRQLSSTRADPRPSAFEFQATKYWLHLVAEVRQRTSTSKQGSGAIGHRRPSGTEPD